MSARALCAGQVFGIPAAKTKLSVQQLACGPERCHGAPTRNCICSEPCGWATQWPNCCVTLTTAGDCKPICHHCAGCLRRNNRAPFATIVPYRHKQTTVCIGVFSHGIRFRPADWIRGGLAFRSCGCDLQSRGVGSSQFAQFVSGRVDRFFEPV